MPTRRFAFEPGGPERLEVSWGWFWKNLTLRLDGQVVGRAPYDEESEITLPDGSTLDVHIRGTDLRIARDGLPLPGTVENSTPSQMLEWSYHATFLAVGLQIMWGLDVGEFATASFAQVAQFCVSVVFSIALLALAPSVKHRSAAALTAAAILTAVTGVLQSILESLRDFDIFDSVVFPLFTTALLATAMMAGVHTIRTMEQQTVQENNEKL